MDSDSDFINAQFESALRLIGWAVRACVKVTNKGLGQKMHRMLIDQCKYLESHFELVETKKPE
jgi:hypothetical protein